MADDARSGLNLVGTTVANIKNDLLGLASAIENQVTPKVRSLVSELERGANLYGGFAGGTGGARGGGNKVAISGAEGGGGGGIAKIADSGAPSGPGGGGNAFGKAALGMQAVMSFGNFVSNAMPSPRIAVQQDLLTAQSAFYGQGGYGGGLSRQTAAIRAMQVALARSGMATSAMDTTQALALAQNLGLSGATNFNQVMSGVATASTFAPGIGVAGATQAMGTLNAPNTVNMLKTVGINIRGMDGSVKPLPQIADELWRFITQNGQVALSERDIQISLMPGNGLYGMLTSLVGNDPTTFTLLSNMLLVKARTGGKALGGMSKGELKDLGLTTATTNKLAAQTAAQTGLLTTTASSIAAGVGASADLGSALNNFATAAGPLTQALGAFSGGYTGVMGLGNGSVGTLLKTASGAMAGAAAGTAIEPGGGTIIGAILGSLFLGKAAGGPVDGKTPYIVGEKGPELFVPKSDGTIVPNHALGLNRAGGGAVSSGGASGFTQTDFAKAILSGLGADATPQAISNLVYWQGLEGGNWKNTAKFNPLNTSYRSAGSVNFNTRVAGAGVQSYGSWGQGISATLSTLTGNMANERGYTDIVNALKTGASREEFMSLLQKSAWDAGHYGGGKSSSGSKATNSNSSLSTSSSRSDYSSQIQGLLASAAGAIGLSAAGTSNTYNNGPLTINITGSSDPKKVAAEVQKVLAANNVIANVGGK